MPDFCLKIVYYLEMPSIVGKRQGGQTYYYLVESARVNGEPRIVPQQYLGPAAEMIAKLTGASAGEPVRSQHKRFGDVAAVCSMLDDLDVAGLVDDVVPGTPTRARRWAPTWPWQRSTGSWARARNGHWLTGGPPRPGRVG
jgi:hypothetical protein